MTKLKIISVFLLLSSVFSFSQNHGYKPVFWRLTNLSGNVRLNGGYNYFENGDDNGETSTINAGISLYTKSFVYHPNLLSLDVSAGYEPGLTKMQAVIRPDYAVNNSSKFIKASALMFKTTNYKLNALVNYNENYSNRENYTSIKSVNSFYGFDLAIKNKFAPFLFSYNNSKTNQLEIQSDREIIRDDVSFEGKTSKNYGDKNVSNLSFKNTNYINGINTTLFNSISNTTVNNLSFDNTVYLNTKREALINSSINNYDFKSSGVKQNRFRVNKRLFFKLPYRFSFTTLYNYSNNKFRNETQEIHDGKGLLEHQLYESLFSQLSYDFSNQKHTFFTENNQNYELNFNYLKKIPLKSRLNISYSYRKSLTNRDSQSNVLPVFNERYTLSDNEILFIKNLNVALETIVVKDVTGTVTFQENADYILIEIGTQIEIKRVPGGLIGNNSLILVDYTALQPGKYDLNGVLNNFRVSLEIYKNIFQVYYGITEMDYTEPVDIDFLTLDSFKQYVYGAQINLGRITGAVKYDNYESDLMPYRILSYELNSTGNFKNKVFYNINLDAINYLMLGEKGRTQQYYNLSGNLSFALDNKSGINIRASYRKQEIDDVNMDWITGWLELTTSFRQLQFKANINYYNKKYLSENSNFIGGNIQLSRNF